MSRPQHVPSELFTAIAGVLFLFQAGGYLSAVLRVDHPIVDVATTSFLFTPFMRNFSGEPLLVFKVAATASVATGIGLLLMAWVMYSRTDHQRIYALTVFLLSMATLAIPGFSLGTLLGSLSGLMGVLRDSRMSQATRAI